MKKILYHISLNINNLSCFIILLLIIQFSDCKSNNTIENKQDNLKEAIDIIIDDYINTDIGRKSIGALINVEYFHYCSIDTDNIVTIKPIILEANEYNNIPFSHFNIIDYKMLNTTITSYIERSGKLFLLKGPIISSSESILNILIKYGLIDKISSKKIYTETYYYFYIILGNEIKKKQCYFEFRT